MSIIAVIGAALQLILLVLQHWFVYSDSKKEERKVLYDAGVQAIKDRDASAITRVFDGFRRV